MNSICFFAAYFKGNTIPYYIKIFVKELKQFFPELVFLTSNNGLLDTEKKFLSDNRITLQVETNDGYDFGLWYKAIQKYDIAKYHRVAFINDSTVLFKSLSDFFSWAETSKADLVGMTESYAVSHHIQSYFLLFKKPVLPLVKKYLLENGIKADINDVIRTYEIGLSNEILKNGFTIAAYVSNNGYRGEFAPSYYCVASHLEQGIPLIKKKIVFATYRRDELNNLARMGFNLNSDYYFNLLSAVNTNLIVDINELKKERVSELKFSDKVLFYLKKWFYKAFRPIYRLFKNDN